MSLSSKVDRQVGAEGGVGNKAQYWGLSGGSVGGSVRAQGAEVSIGVRKRRELKC